MSNLDLHRQPTDPALVFSALGDATRLELVTRLSSGQARSISQLSQGLDLTRQGITKHLRVLEKAGLVRSSRVGREHRFTYAPESVEQARAYLDRVKEQWDEALLSLKAFVEDD